MVEKFILLARGGGKARLMLMYCILRRQAHSDSVNWYSDVPNPPVVRYDYTFVTYPGKKAIVQNDMLRLL